jgi:hypothetical protein
MTSLNVSDGHIEHGIHDPIFHVITTIHIEQELQLHLAEGQRKVIRHVDSFFSFGKALLVS